jgi:LVIVD repeat
MRLAKYFATSIALALLVAVACGPNSKPPATPPASAPASAAKPATPPAPPPAATPAPVPTAPPPAAAATPPAGAGAAAAPGGRGGRGGGTPPPAPVPPPAVMPPPVEPIISATTPSPDPRVGLKAGRWDAGEAAWNMRMISTTPPSPASLGSTHSDLAFSGKYAIQGNYNGFEIYDISNPVKPVLVNAYTCPASQNDVSVYKNLLFMSSEATNSRADCGFGGVPDPVSKDRVRGIRVFDISDIQHPKLVASVQTCRGSHTHTVVTQPGDKDNVYIYVSGTAGVRSADELPGCTDAGRGVNNSSTAQFRLEVIKVPLANPAAAAITSSPRIFNDLPVPPRNEERAAVDAAGRGNATGGRGATPAAGAAGAAGGAVAGGAAGATGGGAAGAGGAGGRGDANATPPPPSGPNQCHDITVYPEIGLGGGACAGLGLLLDIREAAYPIRIDFAADPNMSFWHSATFSNDGKKVLFTDEWGGGGQPRCRATDKMEWGADALFTIENNKLVFHSYYKMPAAQTSEENCVAHNGSLIPIPGRDVMVQAWYQGGVSVFDWTDVAHPKEIAFFDRGPLDATRMVSGGSWSAYWYNGLIVSSEIARGLDIYELVPSGIVTKNELDAAKTVRLDFLNVQDQPKFVWPPSFALARAYLDQLERSQGLKPGVIAVARTQLDGAEKLSGVNRKSSLEKLATQLAGEAETNSTDKAKATLLANAVKDLANATK